MYDSKIRYLASAFVDAESVVPNATDALAFLKSLGNDKFLPFIINEVSATGQVPRLGFHTLDNTSQITLLGKRFNFIVSATNPEGADLGEFSDFCGQAKNILTVALNFFQRKAHRLAAVQEGFLKQMDSQEIDKISLRLFNFPHLYKESVPFEWDWRVASLVERQFAEIKEQTNTITTIKRIPSHTIDFSAGQTSQTLSERVRVDFDINTIPLNKIARFGEQEIYGFFDQVHTWHAELSSEIFSFVFGR